MAGGEATDGRTTSLTPRATARCDSESLRTLLAPFASALARCRNPRLEASTGARPRRSIAFVSSSACVASRRVQIRRRAGNPLRQCAFEAANDVFEAVRPVAVPRTATVRSLFVRDLLHVRELPGRRCLCAPWHSHRSWLRRPHVEQPVGLALTLAGHCRRFARSCDWHDAPVPGNRQTPPMTRAWQVAVLRAHLAHRTAEVEEARDELMAARQRVAELEAAPAARSPEDRRSLLRRLRWR